MMIMKTRKKIIKVGADGLGKSKGVSTVEQFFSRSGILVNMQNIIEFWKGLEILHF